MNTKKYAKKVIVNPNDDIVKEIYNAIELPSNTEKAYTLPTPSDEQNEIIMNFKAGYNLKIEAVAGAGKTTTLLYLAKITAEQFGCKSLILTYNKSLQLEIQNMIDSYKLNCVCYTYHGYASKIYRKCINNDKLLRQCLNDGEPPNNPKIPVLFLDEVQDMNEDYHKLVTKLTYHEQVLVLTGDRRQNIGEYMGSSDKYLINYDQYFTTGRLWKELTLRTSYRLTPSIANFVNKNIINEELIIPGNFKYNDIKPLYYYSEWNFSNSDLLNIMVKKFGPDEVVIMKASVSNISLNKNKTGASCPLGKLVSNSAKYDIKFCVREEESLTDKEMKGKVLLSSFNSMKGKQKLCTIIYSVNEGYFKYYEKGWPDDKKSIPNILYVACTRAQACLILVQDDKSQDLRTTNKDIITSTCNVIGYKDEKADSNNKKKKDNHCITDVIKHRTTTDIIKLLDFIKITEINLGSEPLKYNNLIQFGQYYEDLRTYYGILIPTIAEYQTKGNIRFNETMPLPSEENEMTEPLHVVIRYNQLVLNNNKTYNDWMELSVINDCLSTGHYFKIKQITNYDWVDVNFVEECVNRLLKTIPNDGKFEVATAIKKFNIDKTKYDKYNLNGAIDYLTDDTIWEFKNSSSLTDINKIQLASYISVYYLDKGKLLPGKLFNFRTMELLEITIEDPKSFLDILMLNR